MRELFFNYSYSDVALQDLTRLDSKLFYNTAFRTCMLPIAVNVLLLFLSTYFCYFCHCTFIISGSVLLLFLPMCLTITVKMFGLLQSICFYYCWQLDLNHFVRFSFNFHTMRFTINDLTYSYSFAHTRSLRFIRPVFCFS